MEVLRYGTDSQIPENAKYLERDSGGLNQLTDPQWVLWEESELYTCSWASGWAGHEQNHITKFWSHGDPFLLHKNWRKKTSFRQN